MVEPATRDTAAAARIVEALVQRRRTAGLSQRQVAARMHVSQQAVSEFERLGGDPRLSTLLRYARAVDVRMTVLTYLPAKTP